MAKQLDLMLGNTNVSLNLSMFSPEEINATRKLMDVMDNDIPVSVPFKAELIITKKCEHKITKEN